MAFTPTASNGIYIAGAIDASVVTNISYIGWNKVAQFPPFGAENNVSSYLQWAISLTAVAVSQIFIPKISLLADRAFRSTVLLLLQYPHTQMMVGPTLWLCSMCESSTTSTPFNDY